MGIRLGREGGRMGRLGAALNRTKIRTMETIREVSEVITVNGFRFTKDRKAQLRAMEDGGIWFWVSGKMMEEYVSAMLDQFPSEEELNAALGKEPQVFRIHELVKLRNGNNFRQVDYLGDMNLATGEIE